ncbi:MAG TPA: hypothetical protein VJO33_13205 [Gemmatimonadaceae bacterium]|nr:hypothetical protein [Gemmatimonadaceae bacterium]
MRIRPVVAVVLLVLPAALSAQRIPLPRIPIGGRVGGRELPPQPAPIANELAYKRWHLAVETYPMVSYFQTSGLASAGAAAAWTAVGAGSRADYLINRHVSLTMDMTSSALAAPIIVNTVELGTRVHPEWAEHRLFPYVDLRAGYLTSYDRALATSTGFTDPVAEGFGGPRYSRGFGEVGGGGFEYSLTRTWSLMNEAMIVRSRMRTDDFNTPTHSFTMTGIRYMIGVKYNPVRIIRGTDNTR